MFATNNDSLFKKKILLPGFIADEDKVSLYNLASVFVYPSLYECFGFPPWEAMACGVPVIVSHSSALSEVVGRAGIMIDPYQPNELYQALQTVIADPTFTQHLSQKGLEQAKKFSWEKTGKDTLRALHSLGK